MAVVNLLVTLVLVGLIFAIIWWAISKIPVPEPFSWVITAVFALAVVIVLVSLLTGGLDMGHMAWWNSGCR